MKYIIHYINFISDKNPEIKNSVIKLIDSLDLSKISIADLREYIEYINYINRDHIYYERIHCYKKLVNKLIIERDSRPYNERFSNINTDIQEIIDDVNLPFKSNTECDNI
jgi:hypothetical protein